MKFSGQIVPGAQLVRYRIDLNRVVMRRLYMGIADGTVEADGRIIYIANDIRVGLFTGTDAGETAGIA